MLGGSIALSILTASIKEEAVLKSGGGSMDVLPDDRRVKGP